MPPKAPKFNMTVRNPEDNVLYKRAVYKFPNRKVYAPAKDDTYAIDLIDMSKRPSEKYFKYIMIAVDLVTRKIYYANMKNKTNEEIRIALLSIFDDAKTTPKKIWTDEEAGIKSNDMKVFFEERGIEIYHTFGKNKNAVAERAIRTLKEQMERMQEKWSAIIHEVVEEYNKSFHQSINTTPNDLETDPRKRANYIVKMFNDQFKAKQQIKFEVGQKVRLSRTKKQFEKGYTNRWTEEIYTIGKINNTHPITYSVVDSDGKIMSNNYYNQELISA